MTAMTLEDAVRFTGVDVYDYLDRQAEVPTVTRQACQGDVSILKVTTKAAETVLPKQGVVVATGQGGHDHSIHGDAFFDRAPERSGSLTIGTLTVPVGATVLMSHQEHGALLIAPGTYRIGGQREYAGEWQRVAD